MKKLFGTDGIRGVANEVLTADLALALGRAAGRLVGPTGTVYIGRDTRVSGPMLEGGLVAGVNSVGANAVVLGIVPTPVVSHAVRNSGRTDVIGAVVSASHNPAEDNGIKFFGHDGRKLPDAEEARLEADIKTDWHPGGSVGETRIGTHEIAAYVDWLVGIAGDSLKGLNLAMDAANGAAYQLGRAVFGRAGVNLSADYCESDGHAINRLCGATHPSAVAELTKKTGAEVGVAFDGDADRAIFCTANGDLLNGDRVIGFVAETLKLNGVVGTVMSNGGYEAHLRSRGIKLHRADVGDRYVVRMMDDLGVQVGGEQSGHVVFREHSPTGDGLLTAILFLKSLAESGKSASEVYDSFENWPQVLVNVGVRDKSNWESATEAERAKAERMLEGVGRINVRPSGTQPMLRVMVEASNQSLRDEAAALVVSALMDKMGGTVMSTVDLTHALGD